MVAMRQRLDRPRSFAERIGVAFDEVVYAISPRLGAKRKAIRQRWELHERWSRVQLELQDKKLDDYRNSLSPAGDRLRDGRWMTSELSPDSKLEERLSDLRKRSYELYEEEPFAAGAVEGLVTHVCGAFGIRPQSRIRVRPGILTEEQAANLRSDLEEAFRLWSRRCDHTGTQSWAAVLQEIVRTWLLAGEAFVLESDVGTADKPVPLALEVVAPERIETPPDQYGNPLVRMGVKKNARGHVLGYYVRTKHPGDTKETEIKYEFVEAARMHHLFERLWPGQTRGVPWFTPVMDRMKDCHDFTEYNLIQEQVAACAAAFISGATDPQAVADGAQAPNSNPNERIEDMQPGRVYYLGDGQQVSFSDPNRPSGTLAPYMQWQLRAIAAGLQYPYELLVKDYRELSYSGGRLSLIDGRVMFKRRQFKLTDTVVDPVWARFVDECFLVGAVTVPTNVALDWDEHPEEYHRSVNQMPGWPWVDPAKEVAASKNAVDSDLSTLSDEIGARGNDPEETAAQRTRERIQKLEEYAALKKRCEVLEISDAELAMVIYSNKATATLDPEEEEAEPRKPARAAA